MPDDWSVPVNALERYRRDDNEILYEGRKSLSWCKLKRLGQSRLISSIAFALVFIPIIARILNALNLVGINIHTIGDLSLHVVLPFNWALLYIAAVLFLIGQIVFYTACPNIIKHYSTFSDFEKDHPGTRVLNEWILYLILRLSPGQKLVFTEHLALALQIPVDEEEGFRFEQSIIFGESKGFLWEKHLRALWEHATRYLARSETNRIVVCDVYDTICAAAGRLNHGAMWIVALCFSVGLLLIGTILFQNTVSVVKAMIP